jgi:hypothetical protein
MQGIMKFTFLGIDEFNGKKDPTKKFYNVNLLQGSEIAKVFLESGQEVLFADIQKFDELECVLAFSLGTDKYGAKINYKLLSMKPLELENPYEQNQTDLKADNETLPDASLKPDNEVVPDANLKGKGSERKSA